MGRVGEREGGREGGKKEDSGLGEKDYKGGRGYGVEGKG